MKNLLLILLFAILLIGCGAYKQAAYVSEKAYLGMTLQEFKKIAGRKATLEAMAHGWTIYRMYNYDAWTGARIDTKFFYFNPDGKLDKIDGGVPPETRQSIDLEINK